MTFSLSHEKKRKEARTPRRSRKAPRNDSITFNVSTSSELSSKLRAMNKLELEKFLVDNNIPNGCGVKKFMSIILGSGLEGEKRFSDWANKHKTAGVSFDWQPNMLLPQDQFDAWCQVAKSGKRGSGKGGGFSIAQTKELMEFLTICPNICKLYRSYCFVLKFCPSILAGGFSQEEIGSKLKNLRSRKAPRNDSNGTSERSSNLKSVTFNVSTSSERGNMLKGLSKLRSAALSDINPPSNAPTAPVNQSPPSSSAPIPPSRPTFKSPPNKGDDADWDDII